MVTLEKSESLEIRAEFSEFKGKKYFGMREFYKKNGEWMPSPKGFSIAVTPESLVEIRAFLKETNNMVKEEQ